MQWRLDGAVVMLLTWAPFSVGYDAAIMGAEAHDLASPESASPGSNQGLDQEKLAVLQEQPRVVLVTSFPKRPVPGTGDIPFWVLTPGLARAWIRQLVSAGSGEA